jgi:hypothetical protein
MARVLPEERRLDAGYVCNPGTMLPRSRPLLPDTRDVEPCADLSSFGLPDSIAATAVGQIAPFLAPQPCVRYLMCATISCDGPSREGAMTMTAAVTTGDNPKTTEQILLEEANAIHGAGAVQPGGNLYQQLNKLNSAALCLSGGGIRSASFALGVIQALATHPRPVKGDRVKEPQDSLLAKLHYLSTVSGGGYIGSWLSAWVNRARFADVWRSLVDRPNGPDIEPPTVAWLRSYSNYLTPKLGLMSADFWGAIAIVLRNLILNWLVILPVLCLALLALKAFAIAVAWFSQFDP